MTAIYFPHMHPELAPPDLPAGVKLLSPGFQDHARQELWYLPPELPLSGQECARYAQRVLEFSHQFRDPKEVLALRRDVDQVPFFEDSSQALRAAMTDQSQKDSAQALQQQELKLKQQAQMNLVLIWMLEERAVEMQGLNQGLRSSWTSFRQSLGLEEDPESLAMQPNLGQPLREELVKWSVVLPWFLVFLSSSDSLVVSDPSLVQEWTEYGVSFTQAQGREMGLQDEGLSLLQAQARGFKLLGYSRPIPDCAWLDRTFTVSSLSRTPTSDQ